jgi:hypothetical protein
MLSRHLRVVPVSIIPAVESLMTLVVPYVAVTFTPQ